MNDELTDDDFAAIEEITKTEEKPEQPEKGIGDTIDEIADGETAESTETEDEPDIEEDDDSYEYTNDSGETEKIEKTKLARIIQDHGTSTRKMREAAAYETTRKETNLRLQEANELNANIVKHFQEAMDRFKINLQVAPDDPRFANMTGPDVAQWVQQATAHNKNIDDTFANVAKLSNEKVDPLADQDAVKHGLKVGHRIAQSLAVNDNDWDDMHADSTYRQFVKDGIDMLMKRGATKADAIRTLVTSPSDVGLTTVRDLLAYEKMKDSIKEQPSRTKATQTKAKGKKKNLGPPKDDKDFFARQRKMDEYAEQGFHVTNDQRQKYINDGVQFRPTRKAR